MVVNFLTFSPAKHRKGAVAFRRKFRSVGEETTQRTACGRKVKGGPTWQGGWERFALHRLGSEHWKIHHISLSGKKPFLLPECPFLSRISAHRRPLVKWIAFHSSLGLEVPSQPGFIITQTQRQLTPSSVPGKMTTCAFWVLDKWHLERADWWKRHKNKESSECSQI